MQDLRSCRKIILWRTERAAKDRIINGGIHAAAASRAVRDAVNKKTANCVTPIMVQAFFDTPLLKFKISLPFYPQFFTMKKWKCKVCGYVHTGDVPPSACPVCYVPANQFEEVASTEQMALEKYLEANIKGETWEVTHYMAMALKAQKSGLAEVAEALYRIASEEAYHGANFIQRGSEDKDLQAKLEEQHKLKSELRADMEMMLKGEKMAHLGKNEAASLANAQGKTELAGFFRIAAQDESRHAKMLEGLLKRYF
jgi:rubrerythrin